MQRRKSYTAFPLGRQHNIEDVPTEFMKMPRIPRVYQKGITLHEQSFFFTGNGTMALSNSFGSSTFDILLCLGLPWLIKAVYFSSSGVITIHSKGLQYSIFLLLALLVLVYAMFAANRFTMDKKVTSNF